MPSGRWTALWQTVIRFQKEKITPWLALRNTAGVALPLAIAARLHAVAAGLPVSTGALNVCFSDSQEPYRIRAQRMIAASVLVGVAVCVGALAGHSNHTAVLVSTGWAFIAGMLVALSGTASDLGVISLVTLVVYSAAPLPFDRALSAGALAFAGGLLQTFLAIALWPVRRYEPERRALAALYNELARAAGSPAQASLSPPASAQTTDAQHAMRALAMDHSVDANRYRFLLSQAERIRLTLLMLARLRTRLAREAPEGSAAELLDDIFASCATMLECIGRSLAAAATVHGPALADLESLTERLHHSSGTGADGWTAMMRDARLQADALAGQVRSALELAAHATEKGWEEFATHEARMPHRLRLEGALATLRANLNLGSAAFRHAVRLAVCVAAGDGLGRGLGLGRSYWTAMTVAIILKPDFTSTTTRAVLRLAGTFAGLLLATGLFELLPGGVGWEIALISVLMFILRCFGPANYGIFVTAVTALVVVLFALSGVAPRGVMTTRALNTVLGGVIALAAYAVWPTWERGRVHETLANLLDAYREYFRAVRESYERPEAALARRLDASRLAARLARSNLEASIDRLSVEPGTSDETLGSLNAILASSHRVAHAIMALEAGLATSEPVPARNQFRAYADAFELTFYYLAAALRGSSMQAEMLPDLRERHHDLVHSGSALMHRYALVNIETDRLTNSANTLREQILSSFARHNGQP